MTPEDLPLFSLNLRIWHFMGFLRFTHYYRVLLWIVVPVVNTLLQFLYLTTVLEDLKALGINMYNTSVIFNTCLRFFFLVNNEDRFYAFLCTITDWYNEIVRNGDKFELELLKKATARSRNISMFTLSFVAFSAIFTSICPLVQGERRLLVPIFIPGVDMLQTPIFECIYLIQSLIVLPMVYVTFVPFGNIILSWVLFGIAIMRTLCYRLENIPVGDRDMIRRKLQDCIRFHNDISRIKNEIFNLLKLFVPGRYHEELQSLMSLVSLIELVIFDIMLCVLLLYASFADNYTEKFTAFIYILTIFNFLLLTYWHANEFALQSSKVGNAAYNSPWIHISDPEFRKGIQLIICRSQQRPFQITAGGVFPMTLEMFQSILNASFSFYSLVEGLKEN